MEKAGARARWFLRPSSTLLIRCFDGALYIVQSRFVHIPLLANANKYYMLLRGIAQCD